MTDLKKLREIAGKAKGYNAVVGPMMSMSDLARVIEAGQKGGMEAAWEEAHKEDPKTP